MVLKHDGPRQPHPVSIMLTLAVVGDCFLSGDDARMWSGLLEIPHRFKVPLSSLGALCQRLESPPENPVHIKATDEWG